MDEYTSCPRFWGLTCPGSAEEVGRVRRWARDVLRHCACVDDVAVIVSELSTNAVMHTDSGEGYFHVVLTLSERVVAVSVMDSGGAADAPIAERAEPTATNGRGLALVADLATRLAVRRNEEGHTVTAELLLPTSTQGDAR
ncbi:ATP-binding protein [Streptomyces sp. NPDC052396]|uniref:ATP-binding protein n=1 Tax=Streptomyces sp. NPDC052396 TaxID=3365689 RepID=UPI0037CDD117